MYLIYNQLLNNIIEGFEKPGILFVFNARAKIKPQYPEASGFEDFIFAIRQKTDKITVLQSLLIIPFSE